MLNIGLRNGFGLTVRCLRVNHLAKSTSAQVRELGNPLEFKEWIQIKESLFYLGQKRTPWNRREESPYEVLSPTQGRDLLVDPSNLRDDVIQDFNDLYHTVRDVGYPELADQISGVVFMHATLDEDKCSKCLRVTDYLDRLSNSELSDCLNCCIQWPETIKESGVIKDLLKKLDSELYGRRDDYTVHDRWRLAFGVACLHFMTHFKLPFSVLKSKMEECNLDHIKRESITLKCFLSCACAHQIDSQIIQDWRRISDAFETHILEHLDDYDPVELSVCYAGLKTIRGQASGTLKDSIESRYNFLL